MAIRKISRLQQRRGLKSDLPIKLFEGELGWCLDTRELYIGNSDAYNGNSQILTEYTPNDQLIQHTYKGFTGISANSVGRSIGSKLDDQMSVRDYGAVGNGINDDTLAIQSAIDDRYNKAVANGFSQLNGYVTIVLPAGEYRVTNSLKLYPRVKLQGDGVTRTKITLDSQTIMCVLETADSDGNTGANIGDDFAEIPYGIDLADIWIDQKNPDGHGICIDRANSINLIRCKITGPRVAPSLVQETIGVYIRSFGSVYLPQDILVTESEISGFGHSVYSDDDIVNLRVTLSGIHDCWKGITLGENRTGFGPSLIKVIGCNFKDIDSQGISCYSIIPGVVSSGNSFDSVGVIDSVNPIFFDELSDSCSSIGDQFVNTDGTKEYVELGNSTRNIAINPQKVSFAVFEPLFITAPALTDNTTIPTDYIVYDTTRYNTVNLNYNINRGSDRRTGKLTILTNGTNAIVDDEFSYLGTDCGVTFGYRIDGTLLFLTYTTTSTGLDADFSFTETKWFA